VRELGKISLLNMRSIARRKLEQTRGGVYLYVTEGTLGVGRLLMIFGAAQQSFFQELPLC
jgi:hypothetical protein